MKYLLMINEEQRKALLEVLTGAEPEEHSGKDQPLEYWVAMLEGLPKQEAESPSVIHGFCL